MSQKASVGPAIPAPEIRTDLGFIRRNLVSAVVKARRLIAGAPRRRLNGRLKPRYLKQKRTAFSGTVIVPCHEDDPHVWHSTSVQPFYLCCDSSWVDLPDCGRNCQLAVGDNQPIPRSLAVVLVYLMDNDAAGRRASGPYDSIRFFSSHERRIALSFIGIGFCASIMPVREIMA